MGDFFVSMPTRVVITSPYNWGMSILAGEPGAWPGERFISCAKGATLGIAPGGSELTFESEKDGERRRKSDPAPRADTPPTSPPSSKRKRTGTPEVGQALRSVYQQTIDEQIPPEMLELLGKLG